MLTEQEICIRFREDLGKTSYGNELLNSDRFNDTVIKNAMNLILGFNHKSSDTININDTIMAQTVYETGYCFEVYLAVTLRYAYADFFIKYFKDIPLTTWAIYFSNPNTVINFSPLKIKKLFACGFFADSFLQKVLDTLNAHAKYAFNMKLLLRHFDFLQKNSGTILYLVKTYDIDDDRISAFLNGYLQEMAYSCYNKSHISIMTILLQSPAAIAKYYDRIHDSFYRLMNTYRKVDKNALIKIAELFVANWVPYCKKHALSYYTGFSTGSSLILVDLINLGNAKLLQKYLNEFDFDFTSDNTVRGLLECPECYEIIRRHYMLQKLK